MLTGCILTWEVPILPAILSAELAEASGYRYQLWDVSTSNDDIKGNNFGRHTGVSQWGGAGSVYGNVFDCNLLIPNIEDSEMHKSNKATVDFLLAQTYIRAFHYFKLYHRAYGGVPLVNKVKVLDS